ncbi:hypothetical protein TNCV_2696861 [Trichonephila clavipes]|nr:hypothetical protein TNCV_2696861 [Trichonephila clavipes]
MEECLAYNYKHENGTCQLMPTADLSKAEPDEEFQIIRKKLLRFLRRVLAVMLHYRNPIESSKLDSTASGSMAFIFASLQRST